MKHAHIENHVVKTSILPLHKQTINQSGEQMNLLGTECGSRDLKKQLHQMPEQTTNISGLVIKNNALHDKQWYLFTLLPELTQTSFSLLNVRIISN